MLEGERGLSSEAHVNGWARGGRVGCDVRLRVRAQRVWCGAGWSGRGGRPRVVRGMVARGAVGVSGDVGLAVRGVCGGVCRAVVDVKRKSRRSHGEGKKQRLCREQATNHVEAARSGIGTGAIFCGAQRQSPTATTVVKGGGSAASHHGREPAGERGSSPSVSSGFTREGFATLVDVHGVAAPLRLWRSNTEYSISRLFSFTRLQPRALV